jgi:folate-binding Fe-S cluster repair protein YgfZ
MLSRKNMLDAMMRAKRFYSQSCVAQERLPTLTKIIEISGPDSTKFLQGLCTNQVSQLKSHGDCVPAAFLTPKGRIFVDTLLYLQSSSQADGVSTENILIEVDEAYLSEFKRYLMMYKLKSKVSIKTPNYSVTLETEPDVITNQCINNAVVLQTTDPRHPSLGTRIIAQRNNDPIQGKLSHRQLLVKVTELISP